MCTYFVSKRTVAPLNLPLALGVVGPASDYFHRQHSTNVIHLLLKLPAVVTLQYFWWTMFPVDAVEIPRYKAAALPSEGTHP